MAQIMREDLQRLAIQRLEDAKVLLANERHSAAFYLIGYAVECALKACIAKQTREFEFPDFNRAKKSWKHSLSDLIGETGIPKQSEFQKDRLLEVNWEYVSTKWNEAKRYEFVSPKEAHAIVVAVEDPNHGVLKWLQGHW